MDTVIATKPQTSFLNDKLKLRISQQLLVVNNFLTIAPEIEQGNIEYKLKLINPSTERFAHLVTQLKWRLTEGHGEALYEIGVSDSGLLIGLTPNEMDSSLLTIKQMCRKLNACVSVIRCRDTETHNRRVAEVLIRSGDGDAGRSEIRVAILGAFDAGKSTLLGVLTHDDLDNGRGKSRLNLLRHRHEIESGRTSSISHQILGFDVHGKTINYATTNISTWEHICENSAKLISFLDLCGHPKYQRTTISGLTGQAPDYACLIIAANSGSISPITKEHISISIALQTPIFIVLTKIDSSTPRELTKTLESLLGLLKSLERVPVVIENKNNVDECLKNFVGSSVSPIFLTSSVTGENIDLLYRFFNLLPKPPKTDFISGRESGDEIVFNIDDVFKSADQSFPVVGGILSTGLLSIPSKKKIYYLGPHYGTFIPIQIVSIHRQRCSVNVVKSGQVVTLAIKILAVDSRGRAVIDEDGDSKSEDLEFDQEEVVIGEEEEERGDTLALLQTKQREEKASSNPINIKPPKTISFSSSVAFTPVASTHTSCTISKSLPNTPSYEPSFSIRKGQVILSKLPTKENQTTWQFECEMITSPTDVQGIVFVGTIRQPVKIVERKGDSVVVFRFMNEEEWVTVGATVLFRNSMDGGNACVGKIVRIDG